MVERSRGRRIYKSANGKNVDLDLLIQRNELTPAVGNVRVNARGDELGPGGKIVKKREDVISDYYKQQNKIKDETLVNTGLSAAEAKELEAFDDEPVPPKPTTKTTKTTTKSDDWVEDENGNFIKKGE